MNEPFGIANDFDNISSDIKPSTWDFLNLFVLGQKKSIKILDVGCGMGRNMASLINLGYKNIYGIEYDDRIVKLINRLNPNLKIINDNAQELANIKSNSFHIVYCNQVLEHLVSPDLAISQVHRVLKNTGTFIIGIPHGKHFNEHIVGIIQKLYYGKSEHIQKFTPQDISKMLTKYNFEIRKVRLIMGTIDFYLDQRLNRNRLIKLLTCKIFNLMKLIYWKPKYIEILATKK